MLRPTTGHAGRKKSRPKTPPHPNKATIPQCRMQFDWKKFQQRLKTLQFQRCYFKIRKGRGGIACEIGCGLRNVGSDRSMRVLRDRGGQAAAPVGGGAGQRADALIEARGADGRSGRHRHHRQPNFACNSPAARIDTSSKTAEYQRSEPKLRHAFTGIACEIGG